MAYIPFTFVNVLHGTGDTEAGGSAAYGQSMSQFQGPDGSSSGNPSGLIQASLIVAQPLPAVSYEGFMNGVCFIGQQGVGPVWQSIFPGPGFFGPDNLEGGEADAFTMGLPGYFGRTAVSGYPFQDSSTGRVYFWTRDLVGNWTQQQQINGTSIGDSFGGSCAISGNFAAIQAYGASSNTGQVQVFQLIADSWAQTQILAPGDLSPGDFFGAVFMVGTWLFVSAENQGSNTGAVYVYLETGGVYNFVQKLVGAASNDFFGNGVGCDGTTLAIGAIQNTTGPGYVNVYTLSGGMWTLQTTLTGSGTVTNDWFGAGVAVQGGLMVVGAPNLPSGSVAGKAFVFQGLGASWSEEQILLPTSPSNSGLLFGYSVSIYAAFGQNSYIAVGAPNNIHLDGYTFFFTAEPFDAPTTPAAQMAFYGVRRVQGGYSDPAPSLYPYYEKVFQIPFTFTISAAYNPALPFLSQGSRLLVPIQDYDFELRHITKYSVDASGVPIPYPSPFAIILYDSTYVARMNGPLMAELLCDDLITPNGRNFWPSPPIMYKTDSSIPMDIFTMVEPVTINLPVTVTLLFDGVRRIPCV